MALKPAATNASSKLNEEGSSTVHPKTFPPTTRGGISRPELPSFRLFISILSTFALRISPRTFDEIQGAKVHQESRRARNIHLMCTGGDELRDHPRFAGAHVNMKASLHGDRTCLWNYSENRWKNCANLPCRLANLPIAARKFIARSMPSGVSTLLA